MVKLTPDKSFENHRHGLYDTSFSSYLKVEDIHLGKHKIEDGEIDVFGAEKYFNGGMDEDDTRITKKCSITHHQVKDEPVGIVPVKPKIQAQTPSARSSESSLNSQSALLQGVRNPHQRKTKNKQAKSFLAGFGCKGSCSDKNSLEIDEHVGESNSKKSGKIVAKEPVKNGPDTVGLARASKSRLNPWLMEDLYCEKIDEVGIGLSREDFFRASILNNKWEDLDGNQRKSLEVFGSPILEKKNTPKCLGIERKLSLYNDAESDASSDLFEIESFPNNSNPFPTCYEPSEASIDWSVVTASVADFSFESDSEDPKSSSEATTKARKLGSCAKKEMGKGMMEKRRSGILLLGCKSQKAVRVAGDAIQMTRFQAKNQFIG